MVEIPNVFQCEHFEKFIKALYRLNKKNDG